MTRTGPLSAFAALAASVALAMAAAGFWTAPGVGGASAATGTLSAATISTPSSATGAVTLSWTTPASAPAGSSLSYRVERRSGSGVYAPVSSGGCSGALPKDTISCSDAPSASGSYSYRVVAVLNSWTAVSNEAGPVAVSVDTTSPTVVSINRTGAALTSSGSVSWTVSFSEPVTGVDAADFALAQAGGLTAAAITSVSGSGATRTVSASTGTGSGTLGLDLVDDDTIVDTATLPNPLAGAGTGNGNFTGQTYTLDRAAPTVATIARVGTTPTAAASVSWTVSFSEPVTGVDAADFALAQAGGLTATAITSVSGSGATRTVSASTGTGSGTLGLNLIDDDTIVDAAANPLGGSGTANGNFTGDSYTLDRTAPTLTSLQMLDANTNGKVDRVTATFNETLATSTATPPWTMTGVPSAGTLSSVSTNGATATLTLTEGAGAADTALGSFTVALAANASGIRDTLGNQSSFPTTAPLDRAGPVPVALADTNGPNDGRLEGGDTLAATFSEPLAAGTPAAPTITETRPTSGNASLNISGFTNGALDLGSADYLRSPGTTVSVPATAALSNNSKTLTITAGTCTAGCTNLTGTGTGTTMNYLPAPTLLDAASNPATGTRTSGFRIF